MEVLGPKLTTPELQVLADKLEEQARHVADTFCISGGGILPPVREAIERLLLRYYMVAQFPTAGTYDEYHRIFEAGVVELLHLPPVALFTEPADTVWTAEDQAHYYKWIDIKICYDLKLDDPNWPAETREQNIRHRFHLWIESATAGLPSQDRRKHIPFLLRHELFPYFTDFVTGVPRIGDESRYADLFRDLVLHVLIACDCPAPAYDYDKYLRYYEKELVPELFRKLGDLK